jgi:hypothetical protein
MKIKLGMIYMFDLFKKYVGIYSPYPYTIGGGEKYLAMLMNYFISKGYIVIFFNNTKEEILFKTLKYYLGSNEVICQPTIDFTKKYPFDYFIYMNNSSVPDFKGIGKINIYHCQFPFDLQRNYSTMEKINHKSIISSYQLFIVNSSFTKKYLSIAYSKYDFLLPIYVLNPVCIDKPPILQKKERNSFVMIGRIFEPDPFANNKCFDTAIHVFNALEGCTLYLIGSVKSYSYLQHLKSIITNPNIKLLPDISEKEKNTILSKSEYFIQLTGINDTFVACQEHFGIALIEAISYHCIPISFGGYSTSIIINNYNGYLIKNKDDFQKKIIELLQVENKIWGSVDVTKYKKDYYTSKLESILFANQN